MNLMCVTVCGVPYSGTLLAISFLYNKCFLLSLGMIHRAVTATLFYYTLFLIGEGVSNRGRLRDLVRTFSLIAVTMNFRCSTVVCFTIVPLLCLGLSGGVCLSLFTFFTILMPAFITIVNVLLGKAGCKGCVSNCCPSSNGTFSLSSLLFMNFFFICLFAGSGRNSR